MFTRKKKWIANLSYSVVANGMGFLVSAFSAFFVPKMLGVRPYAYWQLYIFYTTYIGFFHFGWADGIYLLQGGKKYSELDKVSLSSQFRLFVIFELLISVSFIAISSIAVEDTNKRFVLEATGVCLFLTLPRTFLQYLLQTTDRISAYARNVIIEKVIYLFLAAAYLFFAGAKDQRPLVLSDLFARAVTLIQAAWMCRDIVIARSDSLPAAFRNAAYNISVGAPLMFANIAGFLLNGIVKLSVEIRWGIEAFGKTSLTMAVSNILMIFISAVSIVLYPMFRNMDQGSLLSVYKKLRGMLIRFVLGLMVFYYPIRVLLSAWLPQYADSLKYMGLLFPICVFEGKTNMLINTCFKVLRKEKNLLVINCVSVAVAAVITCFMAFVLGSLTGSMLGLLIAIGFRSTLAELCLERMSGLGIKRDILLELIVIFAFVCLSWNVGGWRGMSGYILIYALYLIVEAFMQKSTPEMHGFRKKEMGSHE